MQRMQGERGLGLPDATEALAEMADLEALESQLSQDYPGATLDDVDVETVERALGRQAVDDIERLREIEPEDLLGREPVQLDEAGIGEILRGKTVLITGAGGSIGSELCRQVARFQPARLVLYELSEFNLYSIDQDLGERFPQLPLVRLIGDVKDLAHLRQHIGARCEIEPLFEERALLAKFGGADLTGDKPDLAAGTFWAGYRK